MEKEIIKIPTQPTPKLPQYPEKLTEEIVKDYSKLNIPINNGSKKSIQRIEKP